VINGLTNLVISIDFMPHAFVYQDHKIKKSMATIVGYNNEKTTTMSKTTRSSKLRK